MTIGRPIAVRRLAGALAALALSVAPAPGQVGKDNLPPEVRGLDIVEKPGSAVPLDAELVDSKGQRVRLGDRFCGRPVVLTLVYYDCPVACQAIMMRLAQSLRDLDYAIGERYDVVTVSFDSTNTPLMAAAKKAEMQAEYGRVNPALEEGWTFHVAGESTARAIADSVGFVYRYLPETGEFAHPAGIFVLTPEGKLSRVFYGFDYPARQLKLALLEASDGRVARSWGEKLLLFCYHYDPRRGTYSFAAFRVMQAGAVLTMALLGSLIAGLRLAERARARRAGRRAAAAPDLPRSSVPLAGAGQH